MGDMDLSRQSDVEEAPIDGGDLEEGCSRESDMEKPTMEALPEDVGAFERQTDVTPEELFEEEELREGPVLDSQAGSLPGDMSEHSLDFDEIGSEIARGIALGCVGGLFGIETEMLAVVAVAVVSNVFKEYTDIPAPADASRAAKLVPAKEYAEAGGSSNSLGFYDPSADEVVVNADANENAGSAELLATTVREGFRRASGEGMYAPFAVPSEEAVYRDDLSLGIDEGITEMLSADAVGTLGIDYESSSYPGYVEGARMLGEAMGDRVVREAYLTASPERLRREFESAFASGRFSTNGKYVELLQAINAMGDCLPGSEGYMQARGRLANLLEGYKAGKRAQQSQGTAGMEAIL